MRQTIIWTYNVSLWIVHLDSINIDIWIEILML